MNSKKVYFGMIGLIGILCISAIAAIVLGNSMLKSKSDKLVELKLENRVLEEQQTSLIRANKDIESYSELENITKSIVPQDKDQAKTVREIVKIAEESGIGIANLSFPSSNLGTATPKAKTNTEGSDAAPAAPAAPPITQVKAVEGIPGVYRMEITLQSDTNRPISYSNLIDFLGKLEQNRRTAQVAQINITPKASSPGELTFTLVINVFIKP